jgi:hypothetical protein
MVCTCELMDGILLKERSKHENQDSRLLMEFEAVLLEF